MKYRHFPSGSEWFLVLIIAVQVLVLGVPDPARSASDFNYAAVLESAGAPDDCNGPPFPVAISGTTAVGGLSYCDAGGLTNSGAAVVFEKPGGGWSGTVNQVQFLTPTDQGTNDYFGDGVAIDGNTLVVGSTHTGEPNTNRAVYVFSRSAPGESWTQVAKLSADDNLNSFGTIFAISGSTIVVGDFTPGGDGSRWGAAYVYVEPGSGWTDMTQTAKLVPTNGFGNMRFGTSVAIDGDTIAVGADSDNSNAGGAYVFVKPPGGWGTAGGIESKLVPSGADANAYLGRTRNLIDVHAGTVVLGGLNNQIFIFEEPGTGWADSTQPAAILSPAIGQPTGVAVQDNAVHLNVYFTTGSYGWMTFEKPVSGGWADTSTPSDQTPTPTATGISVDGDTGVTGHYVYVAGVTSTVADLELVKTDDPDPILVGSVLTYEISVINHGPDPATDVTLTDTLPANVVFQDLVATDAAGSPVTTCSVLSGTVTCDLGTLPAAAGSNFATVTIYVKAPASALTLSNTASVAASEFDPGVWPNTVTEFTTVAIPGVEITDTVGDFSDDQLLDFGTVTNGSAVSGTVVITNVGVVPVVIGNVIDPLAIPFTIVSGSACFGTTLASSGASCSLVVAFSPSAEGSYSDTLEFEVGASTASLEVTGDGALMVADIAVDKTVVNADLAEGMATTFTITVVNNGPDTVPVAVEELKPPALAYPVGFVAGPTAGTFDTTTGIWDVGDMASGDTASLVLPMEVSTGVTDCATNTAGALAGLDYTDPFSTNDTSGVLVGLGSCSDLTFDFVITEDDSGSECSGAGGESHKIAGEVWVINNGPNPATGVVTESLIRLSAELIEQKVETISRDSFSEIDNEACTTSAPCDLEPGGSERVYSFDLTGVYCWKFFFYGAFDIKSSDSTDPLFSNNRREFSYGVNDPEVSGTGCCSVDPMTGSTNWREGLGAVTLMSLLLGGWYAVRSRSGFDSPLFLKRAHRDRKKGLQ